MKKVYIVLLTVLIALSVIFTYRSLSSPIKVALIGNFEEERYNFETNSIIAGRIAEKDINDSMGIRGKNTELIIRNDNLQDPMKTVEFLKKNNIEVIITTNSSEELVKFKPYLDKDKIVCISVGSTAATLSGINDYIYRILPDDTKELKTLADYLIAQGSEKDISIVYNSGNLEYKNSVEKVIESIGGRVVIADTWIEDSINYMPSNAEVMRDKPVLIIAPARDAGIIAQKLKAVTKKVYGLSWSGDNNLLVYGGKAVEGLEFTSPVDFTSVTGHYGALSTRLKEYKKSNGLIPDGVYQAYMLIRDAYKEKLEKHITLKEALDSGKVYEGTDDYAKLDEYGDSTSGEYIFTVKDGKFIKIGGSGYENEKN